MKAKLLNYFHCSLIKKKMKTTSRIPLDLTIFTILKISGDKSSKSTISSNSAATHNIYTEMPQNDVSVVGRSASLHDHACYLFENPQEVDNEGFFYSPGYPGFYPNNTDCVLVLTGMKNVSRYLLELKTLLLSFPLY